MDPFGGADEFSPTSPFVEGRYGKIFDPRTGEEIPGGIQGIFSGSRFLGSLLNDIPQVGLLGKLANGGRYEYPEGIPIIAPKPFGEEGEAFAKSPSEGLGILRSFVGGAVPQESNLRDYQQKVQEEIEYGKSNRKSQLKYLRKDLGR
jgi:hypothetical protein